MSKVFYYHTTKLLVTKHNLVPPCTIAVQKDGDVIKYGIAICSKHDNFSRKMGREIALLRLISGFGSIPVEKVLLKRKAPLKDVTDEQLVLTVLWSMAASIVKRNRKWKSKLTKFNKNLPAAAVPTVAPADNAYTWSSK
jgi:hypothetical protein